MEGSTGIEQIDLGEGKAIQYKTKFHHHAEVAKAAEVAFTPSFIEKLPSETKIRIVKDEGRNIAQVHIPGQVIQRFLSENLVRLFRDIEEGIRNLLPAVFKAF